jgi:hypothetical protein
MFGHNKDYKPSEGFPALEPGIYLNWKLVDVTFDTAKKASGDDGKKIIIFSFKGSYEKNGVKYNDVSWNHTEWETDDSSKAANMSKRINHILDKAIGATEEVLETNNSTTFDELGNWVVATFKAGTARAVDFKICGSVYNGKKRAGFPNYLGFIVSHAEKELLFSKGEAADNNKYTKFVPVDSTPDLETDGEEESDNFPLAD